MADTVLVTLSADQFHPASDPHDAIAEVWLGKDGPHPVTVLAERKQDQAQTFVFQTDWKRGGRMLRVIFRNDAYQRGVGDRNLYVRAVVLNGSAYPVPGSGMLKSNGDSATVRFPASDPALKDSPNRTAITQATNPPLVVKGRAYGLAATMDRGQQITVDGQIEASSEQVGTLIVIDGALFQKNAKGDWWTQPLNGGPGDYVAADPTVAAAPAASPVPAAPPPPAAPPVPAAAPAPASSQAAPMPVGAAGAWKPILNATFGRKAADATVRSQADLFGKPQSIAYPWYIYGQANTCPTRTGPGGYAMRGPVGDGADGLYGNYRSRHACFDEGSPQDVHVLGDDALTLRAWCGIANGDAKDCNPPNVVSGILRLIPPIRPGAFCEIRCKMPRGMYAWPAFWLNGPGVQAPWNADGTPGQVTTTPGWDGEIDIFDQYGFNNTPPGRYLIAATPAPHGNAAYAMPGQTDIVDLPVPGAGVNPDTTVASFKPHGWYADAAFDLTADYHTYGFEWGTDGTLGFLLDGVLYRRRGYVWPADKLPAHLIASLQIGTNFNDLSGMSAQGDGWDWDIRWIRAWTR